MVDCARERYVNADTAVAVHFLETVLVPKVSAAYLETMCASFEGSRDPRLKLSFFKGEPTRFIEEATATITSELIDKSVVDVGFPPLDDGFPKWFVDEYVWPLAIRRTRPYVCIFARWQQVLYDLVNLREVSQPLGFSHFLQPSNDFLKGLRKDHGKLVDDDGGDFDSKQLTSENWPSSVNPFSLIHKTHAQNNPTTYGFSSERTDPKPVFRALGLLWHEFFCRLDSDPEVEKHFDQADFSQRAGRAQQEWLLKSFNGVSLYSYRNYVVIPPALQNQLRQGLQNILRQQTLSATQQGRTVEERPESTEGVHNVVVQQNNGGVANDKARVAEDKGQREERGKGRDPGEEAEQGGEKGIGEQVGQVEQGTSESIPTEQGTLRVIACTCNTICSLRVHATLFVCCVCMQNFLRIACACKTVCTLRVHANFLEQLACT